MSKAFEGKVVLVTGANSGIGETAAVRLQEAGATVYGLARREDALAAARSRHPRIHWLLADVTKEAQVTTAVETAAHRGPPIVLPLVWVLVSAVVSADPATLLAG